MWEVDNMDFIIGLPHTSRQHESIWMIVYKVIKSAQFWVVKPTNSEKYYAKIYINEIVTFYEFLFLSF